MQAFCHRLAVLGILFWVGACDTSDGSVIVDAPDAGGDTETAIEQTEPPGLTVDNPPRGAWFDGTSPVLVSGAVSPGTAAISAVKVTGTQVDASGGMFSFEPTVNAGINIVSVRAEAEDGGRSVDGRSFFAGATHPQGALIKNAALIQLGGDFLDDDDPDLDDLAGIMEWLATQESFLDLLKRTVETEQATIIINGAALSSAAVDITASNPQPGDELGEIRVVLNLKDFTIDMDLAGKGLFAELVNGPAVVQTPELVIDIFFRVGAADGDATVEVTYIDIPTDPDTIQISSQTLDEWAKEYPNLAEVLFPLAKEKLLESVETQVSTLLGTFIGDLLNGFSYDLSWGMAPAIDLRMELGNAVVREWGIGLMMDFKSSTTIGAGVAFDPLAGSLRTTSTLPNLPFTTEPLGFVLDDDTLNQLLFTLWFGGLGTGYEATAEELTASGVDTAELPKVFQPLSRLSANLKLPPVVTARERDDEFYFDISVGELQLKIETGTGRTFEMSVNARTGFRVELDADSIIHPLVDVRPKLMDLAVGCYVAPSNIDPGSVAALLRVGFPPILRRAAAGYTFPLPALPLGGALSSVDVLKDKELVFPSMTGSVIGDEKNLLMLEGRALLRTVSP